MLEIVMHSANCSIVELDDGVTQIAFQDPDSKIAVAVRLLPDACETIATRLSGRGIVIAGAPLIMPTPAVEPRH